MKKVSCKGRNQTVCYLQNNPFTLFSSTLLGMLVVLSLCALRYAHIHTLSSMPLAYSTVSQHSR